MITIVTKEGGLESVAYHKVKKDGKPYKRPSEVVAYLNGERVKQCTKCGRWHWFDFFRTYRKSKDGKFSHCRECEDKYFTVYDRSPRGRRRFERRRQLEADVIKSDESYHDFVRHYFGGVCSLTGKDDEPVVLDHIIPLSWGCVGNEQGNLIPLADSVNKIKRNRSIFSVVDELDAEVKHRFYMEVLPFIARENDMTVEEYTEFYRKMEQHRHKGAKS
ncbi:hypothetical protein MOC17_20650 [Bacillus haynesii]|uniref:hypothetical protein n=1 Tax=Bacillus haynesii TaxID=1925021 RepID=UPI002281FC5B|nr:hypothetical protein [Bacillus haynesii]MCY8048466.1 hypothetical protein [Bacillus haynesii]